MNSSKITDAIMRVRTSIQAMPPEELRREFDAFQTTDMYDLLLHSSSEATLHQFNSSVLTGSGFDEMVFSGD